MEPKIKLKCGNCNLEFEKDAREYRRQLKNGKTRFFCNLSCTAIKVNSEVKRTGNPEFLIANNRKDDYSPFRWYVLRGEYRDRKKHYGCDLSAEYLKILWESQNGICPLTGWKLILPKNTAKAWDEKHPANASLDRIDNSKGYIEGNVRFIAFIANIARATFSDDQLFDFCQAVTNNR